VAAAVAAARHGAAQLVQLSPYCDSSGRQLQHVSALCAWAAERASRANRWASPSGQPSGRPRGGGLAAPARGGLPSQPQRPTKRMQPSAARTTSCRRRCRRGGSSCGNCRAPPPAASRARRVICAARQLHGRTNWRWERACAALLYRRRLWRYRLLANWQPRSKGPRGSGCARASPHRTARGSLTPHPQLVTVLYKAGPLHQPQPWRCCGCCLAPAQQPAGTVAPHRVHAGTPAVALVPDAVRLRAASAGIAAEVGG
jgi:hypothetical protein